MALFLSLLAIALMIIDSRWFVLDTGGIAPTVGEGPSARRWTQYAAQLILSVGQLMGDFLSSFLPPETMRPNLDMVCDGPLFELTHGRNNHATNRITTHLYPDQRTSLGWFGETGGNVISLFQRYDEAPRN